MVGDLWGKRFTKKVSFEFRVKQWRGDGWGKWIREGWIEVSIKRWNWFTKWNRKLIPEMRWGILKRAICDLKRRGGRWTSKCDNIRGTSILKSVRQPRGWPKFWDYETPLPSEALGYAFANQLLLQRKLLLFRNNTWSQMSSGLRPKSNSNCLLRICIWVDCFSHLLLAAVTFSTNLSM